MTDNTLSANQNIKSSDKTILTTLSYWVSIQPNKLVWSYLDDVGNINESYSYLQLETITSALAQQLQTKYHLQKNDRILLVFLPGLNFTIALLACFKANLIAVPVFPPDPRKLQKDLHHFISITNNCGAKVVLTDSKYNFVKKVSDIKSIFSSSSSIIWPELTWIPIDNMIQKSLKQTNDSLSMSNTIKLNDIAFLQYTSGSTSEPKGVMISHTNLIHNLELIITSLKANIETRNVSWLPQYHDMGLIGSYLGLLYCGGCGYYLSPISFLKRPLVWIEAMSKYQGTHTQAPNFAYALVVRKVHELKDKSILKNLNLSSIQHMINAAEPIDYMTIVQFYKTFHPFGLSPNVMKPTYGLAEHTVYVCSDGSQILKVKKASLEEGVIEIIQQYTIQSLLSNDKEINVITLIDEDKSNQVIVGCGLPEYGQDVEVIIVDPESLQIVEPLHVGEIWVRSPSKAMGYWLQPEQTKQDFHALVASSESNYEYLRTGDFGFLYQKELFICGRKKDLIIIRGSNHYPQDIERTAEHIAIESLRAGCSAAFAIKKDQASTESVIFIAEIKDDVKSSSYEEISEKCRLAIVNEHGVSLSSICLLTPRTIPKTTSGKIARSWCRRAFEDGTLSIVYRWDSKESNVMISSDSISNSIDTNKETQEKVTAEQVRAMKQEDILKELKKLLIQISLSSPSALSDTVDISSSLSSLGLDSITIIQFKGVLENRFFCQIPDEYFFTNVCCLQSLSIIIKRGELSSQEKEQLQHVLKKDGNEASTTTSMTIEQKEYLCPWFVWCC